MKPFIRRSLEVIALGAILITVTSPITYKAIAQAGPIRGESSAGNYVNIKAATDGNLATYTPFSSYSSGAITVSVVAQTLIPANANRRGLVVANTDTAGLPFYFNFSTITATRAGFLLSGVGASMQFNDRVPTTGISFSAPAATSGWVAEIQ